MLLILLSLLAKEKGLFVVSERIAKILAEVHAHFIISLIKNIFLLKSLT
jgi:hypothetical protein